MKILLISNELRTVDGVTTHLYNLIESLSTYKDIEVYLICGKRSTDKLNNLDVQITENKIFLHEKRSYVNFLKAVGFIRTFVKQKEIDIIHSHTHYAANIAKRAMKNVVPAIQTNHGLLQSKGRLKHFCADKYVAINEHIYEYLLNNKIADKKDIYFIRCGIEIPSEPILKQNGKLKFLAASRLIQSKGLDIFIKAVSKLSDEIKKNAVYIIAGDGDDETSLRELSDNLNTGVNWLGKVENMRELYMNSHVFVFPGRSRTEGFPAAITEAGAYNNLLITSNFLGYDSVIMNNVNALVFEKENEVELASLITNVINNYDMYIPLANEFYGKVKSLYNLNEMAEKHYNMYQACKAE